MNEQWKPIIARVVKAHLSSPVAGLTSHGGLADMISDDLIKVLPSVDNARMSILEEAYKLGFEASSEGDNGEWGSSHNRDRWEAERRATLIEMCNRLSLTLRKFDKDDRVTKIRGSKWTGRVVGFYSTGLTPIGYCVESETETGSVQIYPEAALAKDPLPQE